jgi:hypothetical protein
LRPLNKGFADRLAKNSGKIIEGGVHGEPKRLASKVIALYTNTKELETY